MRGAGRYVLVAAMSVYLLFVAIITLTPSTGDGHSPMWYVHRFLQQFDGVAWVTEPGLQTAANVVLFVPLGLLGVPLVGRHRWWWVVLAGVAMTCFIELVQHWVPGRVPDVYDLVANASGALLGAGAMLLVVRRWPGLAPG